MYLYSSSISSLIKMSSSRRVGVFYVGRSGPSPSGPRGKKNLANSFHLFTFHFQSRNSMRDVRSCFSRLSLTISLNQTSRNCPEVYVSLWQHNVTGSCFTSHVTYFMCNVTFLCFIHCIISYITSHSAHIPRENSAT